MKAVVAAFNQEKALVGAFSVITNLRIELFEALLTTVPDEMYSVLTKLLSQGWIDGALGCLLAAGIGPSLDHSTTKYVLPTMCEYQGGRQHH